MDNQENLNSTQTQPEGTAETATTPAEPAFATEFAEAFADELDQLAPAAEATETVSPPEEQKVATPAKQAEEKAWKAQINKSIQDHRRRKAEEAVKWTMREQELERERAAIQAERQKIAQQRELMLKRPGDFLKENGSNMDEFVRRQMQLDTPQAQIEELRESLGQQISQLKQGYEQQIVDMERKNFNTALADPKWENIRDYFDSPEEVMQYAGRLRQQWYNKTYDPRTGQGEIVDHHQLLEALEKISKNKLDIASKRRAERTSKENPTSTPAPRQTKPNLMAAKQAPRTRVDVDTSTNSAQQREWNAQMAAAWNESE